MSSLYKQVILVRQDLKLPKGKLAVQCCHASLQAALNSDKKILNQWLREGAKKTILQVKDKKDLLKYKKQAEKAGLNVSLVVDAAKTFFKKPTLTCLALGPYPEERIDKITRLLPLLFFI